MTPPSKLWPDMIDLEPGSMVLLLSDGITDNLLIQEILCYMKERNIPRSSETLLAAIDAVTASRMRNSQSINNAARNRGKPYCDGFLQKPKPDNRGFACIEIPREPLVPIVSTGNAVY